MSRPAISSIKLSDTLTLSEYHPTSSHRGAWWLYDKTRGMNLAMGAQTKEDAFVKALSYYQNRLMVVESEYKSMTTKYKSMKTKVDSFVSQFSSEEEGE